MKTLCTLTLLLLSGHLFFAQTAGRQSLNSGGGTVTSGGFIYSYTVGEAITGTSTGGAVVLTKGMQQPEQAASLPIELLSFTAQLHGQAAHLNWITSMEIQSDHFVVERSVDGLLYENIGTVKAAGYSDTAITYSLIDGQAGSLGLKVLFYRLRQYDIDGAFSVSPVVQLTLDGKPRSTSSLFPNPASTEAFLRYQSSSTIQPQYLLTTADGKVIRKHRLQAGAGMLTIPVTALAEGTYFVTFTVGEHRKTHRLIISH
ncbi:MAG: T9SS type A sorting domain-containing protein [Bacteroidia bacterium]